MGKFRRVAEESRVGGVRTRIAAFDVVEAEFIQQVCDQALVLDAEIDAGRLRAVAQRGVEEVEAGFLGLAHGSVPHRGAAPKAPQIG